MPALNEKTLDALEPPAKGRRLVFDDHRDAPRGFGVRVMPSGKTVFILRYQQAGKDRLMSIGERGTWTLAAARKQAQEYRREIDGGTDLLEQRRVERAEPTVAEVAEQYMERKTDKLRSASDVRSAFRRHIVPALGRKKLAEVRRRDVIELVERIADTHPRQAGIVLQYVKGMFGYAEDRELIDANPVATLKPSKIGKGLTSTKRARVLDHDEIRALWGLEAPPRGMHAMSLLILRFILATGQRPGEVCGMRWSEIDGHWWTIPKDRRGKTEDTHAVPLTETALEIIERARAQAPRAGSELVFTVRGGRCDAASLPSAVRRCADALGNREKPDGGHWRPHDLRRTMRTGLSACGVEERVAEAVVGHVRQGIVGVYDQHRYADEKRAAMEAWERRLLNIVAEREDNVVPLAGVRA